MFVSLICRPLDLFHQCVVVNPAVSRRVSVAGLLAVSEGSSCLRDQGFPSGI